MQIFFISVIIAIAAMIFLFLVMAILGPYALPALLALGAFLIIWDLYLRH